MAEDSSVGKGVHCSSEDLGLIPIPQSGIFQPTVTPAPEGSNPVCVCVYFSILPSPGILFKIYI